MKKTVRRLYVTIVCIIIVFLVLSCCLLVHLYETKTQYEGTITRYLSMQNDTLRMSKQIYQVQSLTFMQIISEDESTFEYCSGRVNDLYSDIDALLEDFEQTLTAKDEILVFEQLKIDYRSYATQQSMISDLCENESTATVQYYVDNIMAARLEAVNHDLLTFNEMIDHKIDTKWAQLGHRNHMLSFYLIMLATICLLLVIFLVFQLRHTSQKIVRGFDSEQQRHREKLIGMQQHTIEGMADLVESRDHETGTHIKNTAYYVRLISEQLVRRGNFKNILTPRYIDVLERMAPLHDVGKITVSDMILLKPGKLTPEEFNQMKYHTISGASIIERLLTNIEDPSNVRIAQEIALCHHERWDGDGYPNGLSGTEIPLSARIMAIADVFDALISPRCYKIAFSLDEAFKIIEEGRSKHFDPVIVDTFLSLRPEIEKYLASNDFSNEAVDETAFTIA